MPQTADLLSLRGVSQRSVSYRFRLLDNEDEPIGELHPSRDLPAIITHDSSRFIQRDMANLVLPPTETSDVDPLSNRVQPYMVIEDGTEWPLGVFLFADANRPQYSYGERLVGATLVDKGMILDQPLEHAFSVSDGESFRSGIVRALLDSGVDPVVESGTTVAGGAISWPPGTLLSQVLIDLCTAGGFVPPYFDHDGHCRVRTLIDLQDNRLAFDEPIAYRDGENIYAASATTSDDLLRSPNRFVVIGNSPDNEPVVGHWDVAASAPFSEFNRGFRVPVVIQQQGLATSRDATTVARALSLRQTVFEYVAFSGPPDPRHDAYSIVEFDGEMWLEQLWSLPLSPFGPMTHTIRKVYS